MQKHPVEIAAEIKNYPFFASFDEDLLLQVCTMVREVDFTAGTTILAAGKMNNQLYFLRSGIVEILVEFEKVNELTGVGEVLGEMSVLSGKAVTADIRAKTNTKCFAISADDFAHVQPGQKDRFQLLLYRIYSSVLTDRLTKTNEKAKMYEITARELDKAKRELQVVMSAQMNFLRSEQPKIHKKVLLLEPVKKQQLVVKSAFGGTGVELLIANTIDEAKDFFSQNPDVIFCDETSVDFLKWCHEQKYEKPMALIQSLNFDFALLKAIPFVQHVVSRNPEDRAATVRTLLTTLTKILHTDYFGPQKYLSWGTDLKEQTVTCSADREPLREQMLEHLKSLGVRGTLLDRVQVAAEEMMMNAVYDAPTDKDGKSLYNHLPRSTPVQLKKEEQSTLRFGTDGLWLAVAVEDPFGALPRDIIIKYLDSCYNGAAGSLNSGKGGAGRGLHQILESCDLTVFNVRPGGKTEVIALFDIEASIQKRDSRPQFQFFFAK